MLHRYYTHKANPNAKLERFYLLPEVHNQPRSETGLSPGSPTVCSSNSQIKGGQIP